jgi:GH25 family lysozyme M1 (1,4-beta-N-acetylmuramidase)
MCVGCAAAYAAIAASTVTYSMTDRFGSEAPFIVTVTNADLARAAEIKTAHSGTASITIKSTAPVVKTAAVNRGIDPNSYQAV